MPGVRAIGGEESLRRARIAVIAAAVAATLFKLFVAGTTYGTNDVQYWTGFAQAVRQYGPIGIYGHVLPEPVVYNHPPLAGWLLVALNWLQDRGVASFPFLIRAPACLADLATAVLMLELLRRERSLREAVAAAILVVWSPVLLVVSGFHGNTDPVFLMFTLLAAYLLIVRQRPGSAGICFGIAVSIKLVPIVLAPTLLIIALRRGRRTAGTFAAGGALVFAVLWVPVLVSQWSGFRSDVLEYSGIVVREWGLFQFGEWLQAPAGLTSWLAGSGRFVMVLLSAGIGALIAWRRPSQELPALGVSLALFLLTSSAFGMQYLAWPLAAAYLVNFAAATLYNALASVFIVTVYDQWNNALPWGWYKGFGVAMLDRGYALMVLTWEALALVVVVGVVRAWRATGQPADLIPDGMPFPRDRAADVVPGG
jgi:hypothetical protein